MDRPVRRSRWRSRRLVWSAGALGVLILGGLIWRLLPPADSLTVAASELEIGTVQRAPFQDYLPVRAEVAPLATDFVSAISGGQVDKVLVLDGAEVSAGEALASLTNPQLKLDVSSKEADIAGKLSDASAQTLSLQRNRLDRDKEISETSYNLLKAEHDLDVRRQLHDKGFVSDAEVKTFSDEASYYRDRLKTLKSGQQQEAAISGAQAAQIAQTSTRLKTSLDVVRSSLDALLIRAPVAGRLTDFTLQPGQTLKAGDQVGQIDSEGRYKLTADVDEFYLGRVAPGQKGAADVDGSSLPLIVSRVLPQVTNGRFRTELTFERQPAKPLRRGESVDIRITLGDTRPALVLPNGGWLEAGGGTYAFVLGASGRRADRRPVAIGRRNPEQVEVTSGLRTGERVVTSSYAAFEKSAHLLLH
jgi:HlyD family secretion protein